MRLTVTSSRARRDRSTSIVGALIRRMQLVASSAVQWSLQGFLDEDGSVEAEEAEVFPGVGVFARPKSGDNAEAIVLKVGGASGHAVIVATRNQDGIKRIGSLGEDETIIFTSTTAVKITASGQVLIGAIGAPLLPLTHGVVLASGVDTFTGATYGALGSASTKVMAEK
jgi:hypothetical protein